MLNLHDLEDFMDTNAASAEQAEAAKRQEPSTAVQDDTHRNNNVLKGVQSRLSATQQSR